MEQSGLTPGHDTGRFISRLTIQLGRLGDPENPPLPEKMETARSITSLAETVRSSLFGGWGAWLWVSGTAPTSMQKRGRRSYGFRSMQEAPESQTGTISIAGFQGKEVGPTISEKARGVDPIFFIRARGLKELHEIGDEIDSR